MLSVIKIYTLEMLIMKNISAKKINFRTPCCKILKICLRVSKR